MPSIRPTIPTRRPATPSSRRSKRSGRASRAWTPRWLGRPTWIRPRTSREPTRGAAPRGPRGLAHAGTPYERFDFTHVEAAVRALENGSSGRFFMKAGLALRVEQGKLVIEGTDGLQRPRTRGRSSGRSLARPRSRKQSSGWPAYCPFRLSRETAAPIGCVKGSALRHRRSRASDRQSRRWPKRNLRGLYVRLQLRKRDPVLG